MVVLCAMMKISRNGHHRFNASVISTWNIYSLDDAWARFDMSYQLVFCLSWGQWDISLVKSNSWLAILVLWPTAIDLWPFDGLLIDDSWRLALRRMWLMATEVISMRHRRSQRGLSRVGVMTNLWLAVLVPQPRSTELCLFGRLVVDLFGG